MSVIKLNPNQTKSFDKRLDDVEADMQALQDDYNYSNSEGVFHDTYNGETVEIDESGLSGGNVDLSDYAKKTELDGKVDKVSGKQLSTEDYTTAEKNKLANLVFVNIKANGTVKGDGVTDDTAAINAIIATMTNEGTLVFPPGTYLCSGVLNFNKDNLRIIGDNAILKCTTKQYFVHLKGKNIIMENMIIDGNSIAQVGLQVDDTSENIKVINCEVHHCGNLTESSWIYGIQISANACKNVLIDGCYIHDIKTMSNGTVGDSYGMDKGIMIGSTAGSTGACSQYITIQNCRLEDIGGVEDGSAIAIYGLTASTPDIDTCNFYITIKNNYFNRIEKSFIKVMPCSYVWIEDNVMINPYVTDADAMYSGISCYGSHCIIKNNQITGGWFILGFEIGNDKILDVKVVNNTLITTTTTAANVRGISTKLIYMNGTGANTMNDVLIDGNYLDGQSYGIVPANQKQTNITISNNQVKSVANVGIWLCDYGKFIKIINNMINIPGNAIVLDKLALGSATFQYVTIADNMIHGTGYGINIKYGDTIIVSDNNSDTVGVLNIAAGVTNAHAHNNYYASGGVATVVG